MARPITFSFAFVGSHDRLSLDLDSNTTVFNAKKLLQSQEPSKIKDLDRTKLIFRSRILADDSLVIYSQAGSGDIIFIQPETLFEPLRVAIRPPPSLDRILPADQNTSEIDKLCEIGFPRSAVESALATAGGNVDKAADLLVKQQTAHPPALSTDQQALLNELTSIAGSRLTRDQLIELARKVQWDPEAAGNEILRRLFA
jgi:hypothetical protein